MRHLCKVKMLLPILWHAHLTHSQHYYEHLRSGWMVFFAAHTLCHFMFLILMFLILVLFVSSFIGSTIKQAVEHALKVQTEGACRHPRPKLIRVQEFYPHPGKTYLPHCTILHQCSDDTGCCKNDLTCSPKTTQRVELSFYVSTLVVSVSAY